MARQKYRSTSAYAATPQLSWRIANYVHRKIPSDSTDSIYEIEPRFDLRPDLLAYHLYSTPDLWWVFTSRNTDTLRDPIWDFRAGKSIIVPSLAHVKATIG